MEEQRAHTEEETKTSRMKLCDVLKNFKNLPITRDYGKHAYVTRLCELKHNNIMNFK